MNVEEQFGLVTDRQPGLTGRQQLLMDMSNDIMRLYVHGILSHTEKGKARARLDKKIEKAFPEPAGRTGAGSSVELPPVNTKGP